MANRKNKVKFGLKNCHYALVTIDEDGKVTFGTPVSMPGSVSLSLDAEGDNDPFYADDSVYYMVSNNNGYSGDFELALIPESFLVDVLHETEDANGVLVENKDVEPEHFALLFEFSGDQRKIRHCLYYCSATRPSMEGDTTEDKKEVKTEKLSLTVSPLPSGLVKVKTGTNTSEETYNNWYTKVYEPQDKTTTTTAAASTSKAPVPLRQRLPRPARRQHKEAALWQLQKPSRLTASRSNSVPLPPFLVYTGTNFTGIFTRI
jgi:phi13 family phage major tail protein